MQAVGLRRWGSTAAALAVAAAPAPAVAHHCGEDDAVCSTAYVAHTCAAAPDACARAVHDESGICQAFFGSIDCRVRRLLDDAPLVRSVIACGDGALAELLEVEAEALSGDAAGAAARAAALGPGAVSCTQGSS